MLEIELNGAAYSVAPGSSLLELAAGLGLAQQAVAVAVNCEVVPRAEWPRRQLQAHDRVDVVRAIGGG